MSPTTLSGTTGSLLEEHDVLLLDLDGTVWLGGTVLPHVLDVLTGASRKGLRSVYVTNNASRSPADVAATLVAGGLTVDPADVVTSAQAAAALLAGQLPAGAAVLVVGAEALIAEAAARGLRPVTSGETRAGHLRNPDADGSDRVAGVLQGFSPDTGWRDLAAAAHAVAAGAVWVASNEDVTIPTPEGLAPGNGSLVGVVAAATGHRPQVAGKPGPALLAAAVERTGARAPLVVGDRLDTDLAAAVRASLPGLLVLSGVSTAADLVRAPAAQRPRYIAKDLRGLLERQPEVRVDGTRHACGCWEAVVTAGVVEVRRLDPVGARGQGGAAGTGGAGGRGAGGPGARVPDSARGHSVQEDGVQEVGVQEVGGRGDSAEEVGGRGDGAQHGGGPGDPGSGLGDGLDGLRALCGAVWAAVDGRSDPARAERDALPAGLDEALAACTAGVRDPARGGRG